MEWLRNWSWRLAILALPWQTRYIVSVLPTPEAGYQTEWGIYAFYASWIIILFAWLLSLSRTAANIVVPKFVWYALALLLIPIVLNPTLYSLQVIAQLIVILFLADTLHRHRVSRADLSAWFLLSLVPHLFLSVWQFDAQVIAPNKWLGISGQDPQTPGVSVLGDARTLRAYAGFPHPNIAGIWFALGLAASIDLVRRAQRHWQIILAWFMCAALPIALVLTFSRSAWIVAALLIAAQLVMILRRPVDVYTLRAMILALLCALIASIPVLHLIGGRASLGSRLETKSAVERTTAWKGIWPVVLQSPIVGHGLGSSVEVMAKNGLGSQPPHTLPLVILLESGLMGLIGILILLGLLWRHGDRTGRLLLSSLAIPALLDHYLWTLWAGQILAFLCIFWYQKQAQSIDNKIKS